MRRALKALLASAALFLLHYLLLFNYVEQYEVGISWNRLSGELRLQRSGCHVTAPWVSASRIDTRPQRVCLTSAGHSYSCKLARFVPDQYVQFVAVEGHRYYWWANRISFNSGYPEEYRGVRDILRGHAFGTARYGFVEILEE